MNQTNTESTARLTFRGSRDALLQRAVDEPDIGWRVLTTLNAFRLLIAAVLLSLFFATGEPRIFGDRAPTLFAAGASAYLVFGLFFWLVLRHRWARFNVQAIAHLLTDIVAISVLMYTSGGVSSGLGGLLVVFIGAGALVLPARLPTIRRLGVTR